MRKDIHIYVLVLIFCIYFSLLSINRLDTFRSNYFDLGIMDQTVYNTSKGRFLELTNPHVGRNTSRLAIHFDPALAVFAPLYWLFPSPSVLLIVQAIFIGLGGLAVYWIGLHLIKNRFVSTVFALSYLFYFPNQRAVIFDFHAVLLATPLLLFGILAELKGKNRFMFACVFVALLTKEHVGLSVFMYGLYLYFVRKNRRYGLLVSTISIVVFISAVKVVIPHYNQGEHFALKFFKNLEKSPIDAVLYIFGSLISFDGKVYLAQVLIPSILYAVFAPVQFLAVLPELIINLVSSNSNMRAIYFHYNAVATPFLYFAAISGYVSVAKLVSSRYVRFAWLGLYVFMSGYMSYYYDPLPFSFMREPYMFQEINQVKMHAIRLWQERLKDDSIAVSTTPKIAPFFTRRRHFYNFLYDPGFVSAGISENDIIKEVGTYKKADYVVLEKEEARAEEILPKLFYVDLQQNGDYELVYEDQFFEVYKKSLKDI